MFDELKRKLKDRYYIFLAQKYIKNLKNQHNFEGLSPEAVPEEVIYKILEKGLTQDENLIYSLIINLTSKEARKEMIAKYITNEDYPDISIIKKLPPALKIEILENKILGYREDEIKEILIELDDHNFIRLLESNKDVLDKYFKEEDNIVKLNTTYIDPNRFLETVIYSKFQKIEDEQLKKHFEEIIPIKTLTDRIDDKILGVVGYEYETERYITAHMGKITSEDKKVEYLSKHSYDIKSFGLMYRTLSEESKRKVLLTIFSKEKIKEYVSQRKQRKIVQNFGTYVKEYCDFAEMDIETIKDLYYILPEESSDRIILYNMVQDEEKVKLLLDEKNYSTPSNEVIDLMFDIQDEELLVETIHKYIENFKNKHIENTKQLYEYVISKLNDELKVKVVQYEIDKKENVNKNLLLLTFPEINDKDALKQILSQELNEKYYRLNEQTDINIINSIIAEKIIVHGLADELLIETNINNFSEENKFLLLLNASKEVREKVLEKNDKLRNIVNAINENEDVIKKISEGTSNYKGRLIFYKNLIAEIKQGTKEEKSFTLSEKLAILEQFQQNHASIGETMCLIF